LDITLPDIDGIIICRKLKEDIFLSRIPVIIVTAREIDEERGFQIGADDYVKKPFKKDKLLACIEALLRQV